MSPIPLIARQRALSRIGEIRCGDEKHDGKVGRKLETFRLTSQHRDVLERAAELYGGEVKEWESPTGPAWQVITTRSSLPVLVIPGYSLRRAYEKWAGPSKRERICDGEEEVLSGEPCLCNAQGKDECKILTRLMVLLPETGTSLGWQLSSTGETAADELDLAMKIAEGIALGRPFVPGTISLTQRKGQLNGQATRFVVPVLGFNPLQSLVAGELPADRPALPAGYTPLTGNGGNGVTLEQGLEIAETQTVTRTRKGSTPITPAQDDLPFDDVPVPVVTDDVAPPPSDDGKRTKDQNDALNALYGELTRLEAITVEQVYAAVTRLRNNLDLETMVGLIDGRKLDGSLSFAKLRDSLSKVEASSLIDRLGRYADNLKAQATAESEPP